MYACKSLAPSDMHVWQALEFSIVSHILLQVPILESWKC